MFLNIELMSPNLHMTLSLNTYGYDGVLIPPIVSGNTLKVVWRTFTCKI